MIDSLAILSLYANVLHEEISCYNISAEDIRVGIQNMKDVYLPDPTSLLSSTLNVANYNDIAHRCAYLHKYAALHTDMVENMMRRILQENVSVFKNLLSGNGDFKLCSLGGGPGSDVIGVLAALLDVFYDFKASVTIVDYMENWKYTFHTIIQELRSGRYGSLITNHVIENFEYTYIGANLLTKMTDSVNKAISSAALITMIKFISAAACKETETMINKIFRCMKPGALILYVDNAGGGFHQLMARAARANRFISIFGPLKHETYSKPELEIKRFGYTSCYSTTVTVQVFRKPFQNQNKQGSRVPKQSNPQSYIIHTTDNVNSRNILNDNDKLTNFKSKHLLSNNRPKLSHGENTINTINPVTSQPRSNTAAKFNNTMRSAGNQINNFSRQHNYSPLPTTITTITSPSNASVTTPASSITTRSTNSNTENHFEDACCSCCVIS